MPGSDPLLLADNNDLGRRGRVVAVVAALKVALKQDAIYRVIQQL